MACAPDQTLGWGWSDGGGEQSGTGILGTCVIAAGFVAHILMMEMMRKAHVGLGSSMCLHAWCSVFIEDGIKVRTLELEAWIQILTFKKNVGNQFD